MHGYFMDIRLYNQAKSVAEPFAFAEYRKKRLHEKIYLKRVKSRVPMPVKFYILLSNRVLVCFGKIDCINS
ncbi:unnamed protein product [Rotaria socialis]